MVSCVYLASCITYYHTNISVFELANTCTVFLAVTWFKTHEIYKSHINYSIAYPKPQNTRVLLGYCSHFVSFNRVRTVFLDTVLATH